jgi:hypothetical protein
MFPDQLYKSWFEIVYQPAAPGPLDVCLKPINEVDAKSFSDRSHFKEREFITTRLQSQ